MNCRYVESNVFENNKEVQQELSRFVLVRLYVDPGPHATAEEAEKNFDYEDKAFGEIVQPIYGVIEADGKVVAKADYNLAQSAETFLPWLRQHTGP